MNEKKLTDEEVAQALLQNIQYGKAITYFDKWGNHKSIKVADILDFIYRLQDEKQKVVQDYYCEAQHCDVQKDIIEKQKAEIERLTEENEYLDMCGKQFLADYQKCEVERAELENQVDELKKERENVQKILYELGKCGNDKERYAVWVKLIKYCGVEVE